MLKLKLQNWPPDAESHLIGKDSDAGKGWRLKEKEMAEDKMVGQHHRTQWTWIWASSQETVENRQAWYAAVHGIIKNQTWLSNWTTTATFVVELIIQIYVPYMAWPCSRSCSFPQSSCYLSSSSKLGVVISNSCKYLTYFCRQRESTKALVLHRESSSPPLHL